MIEGSRWSCSGVHTDCDDEDYCDAHYATITAAGVRNSADLYPIRRARMPPSNLAAPTAIQTVLNALANYGEAPFIGVMPAGMAVAEQVWYRADARRAWHRTNSSQRRTVGHYHPSTRLRQYIWTSFSALQTQVLALASSLRRILPPGAMLGLYAPNSLQWVVADFACIAAAIPSVAIHASYPLDTVEAILCATRLPALLIHGEVQARQVLQLRDRWHSTTLPSGSVETFPLRFLIVVDGASLSVALQEQVRHAGMYLLDFASFVSLSVDSAAARLEPIVHRPPDAVSSIVYTSGSTGVPKGSLLTERLVAHELKLPYTRLMVGELELLHVPMAWATGRDRVLHCLMQGATLALYSGHPSGLLREFKAVAPRMIIAVPLVWGELFSMYKASAKLQAATPDAPPSAMFSTEVSVEPDHAGSEGAADDDPEIAQLRAALEQTCEKAFPRVSAFRSTWPLGPRLTKAIIGGAASSPELRAFLQCFIRRPQQQLVHSYGLTEVGGVLADGFLFDGVEFLLLPVPLLGYNATGKQPTGELAVKTNTMTTGYFGEDANAPKPDGSWTSHGYFRTGDIVQQLGEREFVLLDRVASHFKMADGEFVSPEALENVYRRSSLIRDVFAYGSPTRPGILALVVPNMATIATALHASVQGTDVQDEAAMAEFGAAVRQLAAEGDGAVGLDRESPSGQLLHSRAVEVLLRADLSVHCREAKFPTKHFPLAVLVAEESFLTASALLTPSGKLNRRRVAEHYMSRFERTYDELERQRGAVAEDTTGVPQKPDAPTQSSGAANTLAAILSRVLSVSLDTLSHNVDVSALGLSSLSATVLAQTIQATGCHGACRAFLSAIRTGAHVRAIDTDGQFGIKPRRLKAEQANQCC